MSDEKDPWDPNLTQNLKVPTTPKCSHGVYLTGYCHDCNLANERIAKLNQVADWEAGKNRISMEDPNVLSGGICERD